MGHSKFLFVLLGIGAVITSAVLVTLKQQGVSFGDQARLPIPTLNLSVANSPRSTLLGQSAGDIAVYQYNEVQTANGVTIHADDHNFTICATNGQILGLVLALDSTTRFWGYEYTGNEQQNEADGLTGRDLFEGRFFVSQGQLDEYPGRYDFLNTMTDIKADTFYYWMAEADLDYKCDTGLNPSSSTGSSSSSVSSGTGSSISSESSSSLSSSSSVSSDSSSSSSDQSSSESASSSSQTSSSSSSGGGGNGGTSSSSDTSSSVSISSSSDSSISSGTGSSVSSSSESSVASGTGSSLSSSSSLSSDSSSSSFGAAPICGNGTVEPPEQCDDGNTDNGDGCFENCTFMIPPDDLP